MCLDCELVEGLVIVCVCVCVSGLMLMEGGEGVLAITYAPPDTGKDYACVRVCMHVVSN